MSVRSIILKIRIYLLRLELNSCDQFFIGGYNRNMVRVNNRYLADWEVDFVHKWELEGKVKPAGKKSITSKATGITYIDKMYSYANRQ